METIKAIVVEDEFKVREVFVALLQRFCPEIEIVGVAENIKDAYELIIEKQPEVVFLDIEMPGGTGFDLLTMFEEVPFETIFVTSYGHYAIKAIKFSALDYLLKPVMIEDLQNMTARIKDRLNVKQNNEQYKLLNENLNGSEQNKKLVINTKTKVEYIYINDITFLKGDGNYTNIYLASKQKFHISKTLREYEDILCDIDSSFVRSHKTTIVNTMHIKHIERGNDLAIILNDNTRLEISRRKKQEIMDKLHL